MGYLPNKHGNLGYVDIAYRELLDKLVALHKRPMKNELEWLIAEAAKKEKLT